MGGEGGWRAETVCELTLSKKPVQLRPGICSSAAATPAGEGRGAARWHMCGLCSGAGLAVLLVQQHVGAWSTHC